jgi:hypothetical protein
MLTLTKEKSVNVADILGWIQKIDYVGDRLDTKNRLCRG